MIQPIVFPDIITLINFSEDTGKDDLDILNRLGLVPEYYDVEHTSSFGIEINLEDFGSVKKEKQVYNTIDISDSIGFKKSLPKTKEELLPLMMKIKNTRTSQKNDSYNVPALRIICRNLGIPTGNNKETLVNRIKIEMAPYIKAEQIKNENYQKSSLKK